ncbi:hypothetical protein ThvES_00020950, partial [Thiovulum sp. ES]
MHSQRGGFATGESSTAFGIATNASSYGSTAFGIGTVANEDSMTAIGKYNTLENSHALFVVGNGADSQNRSDALKVFDDGNVSVSGTLFVNGTEISSS